MSRGCPCITWDALPKRTAWQGRHHPGFCPFAVGSCAPAPTAEYLRTRWRVEKKWGWRARGNVAQLSNLLLSRWQMVGCARKRTGPTYYKLQMLWRTYISWRVILHISIIGRIWTYLNFAKWRHLKNPLESGDFHLPPLIQPDDTLLHLKKNPPILNQHRLLLKLQHADCFWAYAL